MVWASWAQQNRPAACSDQASVTRSKPSGAEETGHDGTCAASEGGGRAGGHPDLLLQGGDTAGQACRLEDGNLGRVGGLLLLQAFQAYADAIDPAVFGLASYSTSTSPAPKIARRSAGSWRPV